MALKRITQDELEVFLRKHKLWLIGDSNGERANLTGADLPRANLTGANLTRADLTRANLTGANLTGANLTGADLTRADLTRANLTGADLTRANCPMVCPEKGSFIGFKKARGEYIVELEIPADALRSSATGRKCRCSKAKVISITDISGNPVDINRVYSKHDVAFGYTVGEMVSVDNFDPNRWNECAPGIHFFITRDEAVNY